MCGRVPHGFGSRAGIDVEVCERLGVHFHEYKGYHMKSICALILGVFVMFGTARTANAQQVTVNNNIYYQTPYGYQYYAPYQQYQQQYPYYGYAFPGNNNFYRYGGMYGRDWYRRTDWRQYGLR